MNGFFCTLFNEAFSASRIHIVHDRVTSEWWWRWIHEDKYPCLKRDSNPRSRRPSDQGTCLTLRGQIGKMNRKCGDFRIVEKSPSSGTKFHYCSHKRPAAAGPYPEPVQRKPHPQTLFTQDPFWGVVYWLSWFSSIPLGKWWDSTLN
jgi:hypothetical protein